MAGIREILVLAVIILGVLLIPRLIPRKETARRAVSPALVLSGKLRLAIAASLGWPTIMAAFLQPWLNDPILYLYIGIGPVVLGWMLYWVLMGYRQPKR
ncbi:MAG: hypothetical protein ABFS45_23365 [Pseudomonadota bacterium]